MILSNPVKSFLLVLAILTFCFGCRFCQNPANTNTSPGSESFPEDKSDLPFSTREPDVYQARIVVTSGGTQRVTFVARNGAKRRCGYEAWESGTAVWLRTDKDYLLLPEKKIYMEEGPPGEGPAPSAAVDALTVEWLNIRASSKFQDLGAENGLRKFSAKLDESDVSEVLLFIDEASGLPLRQEYYSISGEGRELVYSFEVRDLKLEAGDDLFTIPGDYRKVSTDEFHARRKTK